MCICVKATKGEENDGYDVCVYTCAKNR